MASVSERADHLLEQQFDAIHCRTDWLFACLLIMQWIAAVGIAMWLSPQTWAGTQSQIHVHVWAALLLGGCITSLPVYLTVVRPGATLTRHTIALAQMAWSALLIHLTGGRIETHFHIFGSLALLAAYRDWRVLVTATVAAAADHWVRGMFWPQSIYGIVNAAPYRVVEHVGWILFEDLFLMIAIRHSVREMSEIALQRARLEQAHRGLESEFAARTRQYQDYTGQLETARRTLEQQAQALQQQTVELRDARAQAEAANRAKSDFLASMSHEIRTPMTAVLGFAEVLIAKLRDPEALQAARTIKRNGDYLLEILDGILDLSKVEAGRLHVERARCSPHQIVNETVQLMRVRAEAKGIQLAVDYQGPIPATIRTDSMRLRQILLNLVGNAIKFSDRGEVCVVVELEAADGPEPQLRFSVTDQGVGLTQAQLAQLFQPFVQGDVSTARRFGGSGLGLSISKRLAEILGGGLTCTQSALGRGTTFSVTVATGPLDGACLLRQGEAPPLPPSDEPPQPLWGTATLDCNVLLVDDSPDNQDLVSFVLRKAGARVAVADHGQQALDMALRAVAAGKPYDVILMDMEMPVLDGYAATRCLRARDYRGPIIALTAHAMPEELQHCISAGCDACVTKPIDHTLVPLIAQHTARAVQQPTTGASS